jgi:hypothetical protein
VTALTIFGVTIKNTRRTDSLDSIINELNANPTERNWISFSKALDGSGISYYHAVYPSKVDGADDLGKAYIILYDSKYARKSRIPAYMKAGPRTKGALHYLKGLSANRRMMKT